MTTGQQITRNILIVGSLLLATGAYFQPSIQGYEVDSVTAKALQSLVYGFLPAGVGFVLASIRRFLSPSTTPNGSYLIWHVTWGILLFTTTVGGGHLRQLQQLLLLN